MAKAKALRARADARIARLNQQQRKLETSQKIILASMFLDEARHNATVRAAVLQRLHAVTRDYDRNRVAPLIQELEDLDRQQKATQGSPQAPLAENGSGPS